MFGQCRRLCWKISYVQTIHSQCRFCKLKMLYVFKTFVSLLSGHDSYLKHVILSRGDCTKSYRCPQSVQIVSCSVPPSSLDYADNQLSSTARHRTCLWLHVSEQRHHQIALIIHIWHADRVTGPSRDTLLCHRNDSCTYHLGVLLHARIPQHRYQPHYTLLWW